jgi:hypothetical protein|tara:strand:+ start:727 stop:831 length:105 start_codon:yes stop_codon:yes gene_type:complete
MLGSGAAESTVKADAGKGENFGASGHDFIVVDEV